jgi:hypothetical protein
MFGRKGLKPGEVAGAPRSPHTPQARPASVGNGVPGPVSAAATYLGCISPGAPVFIEELSGMTPCQGPQGATGVCFLFTGADAKHGKAYFFPSFASIWVDGEAGPRAQIPNEMIWNQVPNYLPTLNALITGVEGQLDMIRKAMVS